MSDVNRTIEGSQEVWDQSECRFPVGCRVTRHTNVYDRRSPLKHGTVVRAELDKSELVRWNRKRWLYSVLWDGEVYPNHGYLWHGLDFEEAT